MGGFGEPAAEGLIGGWALGDPFWEPLGEILLLKAPPKRGLVVVFWGTNRLKFEWVLSSDPGIADDAGGFCS